MPLRTQKRDHINVFGGNFGSKKGSQTGHFRPQKVWLGGGLGGGQGVATKSLARKAHQHPPPQRSPTPCSTPLGSGCRFQVGPRPGGLTNPDAGPGVPGERVQGFHGSPPVLQGLLLGVFGRGGGGHGDTTSMAQGWGCPP